MQQKLVSRTAFAQLAGVSRAAVTKACATTLKPAISAKRINAAHPSAVAYLKTRASPTPNDPASGIDNLYQEAIDTCKISGRWTVSSLQRQLKIGYSRASKIMDMMVAARVIPRNPKPNPNHKSAPPPPIRKADEALAAMAAAEQAEHIHKIPDDIAQFADMTLRELILRFGTVTGFNDWLKATNSIEAINEKRLKNAQTKGRLVSREAMKLGVIEPINTAHIQLLTDGTRAMAVRAVSICAAGGTSEELEKYFAIAIGKFIEPVKAKVARAMREP